MEMGLPKFHDRKSLVVGAIAGLFVAGVGIGLSLHCLDMISYYKKHRIIKIEKTDTHRIITKDDK
jgi:hypothetical protein